jgi:hypothetical protein
VVDDLGSDGLPGDASAIARLRSVVTRHPIIVGVLVGSTLLGLVLGVFLLPQEWTVVRRILGGAVSGAGCGLICTAPRIIG